MQNPKEFIQVFIRMLGFPMKWNFKQENYRIEKDKVEAYNALRNL